ncbi:MAG: hypothetical protein GF365_03720 [Candidatus Buchananbacteria bacterium]|nr:hypothetical protein [Candidatus Buchananbacteria bacterium]
MSKKNEHDGTYLLLYPEGERRREARKIPKNEIDAEFQDPTKQRKSPRKKPTVTIYGRVWAVADLTCEVVDISRGGIRVRSKVALSKGEEVGLHLLVSESANKQVPVFPTCQIVWIESENKDFTPPYQMGLKILQMTERQADVWGGFVDRLPELKPASN